MKPSIFKAGKVRNLTLILTMVLTSLFLTGCKKKIEHSRVAYIIGEDDMNIIDSGSEIYKSYKDLIDSSVLIVTKTNSGTSQFCSGVLVNVDGNLRILTNHHCFAIKDDSGLATPNLLDTACDKTSVYFNVVEGALNYVTKADCIENSLVTDFAADLASFSIEGTLPENAKPISLYTSDSVEGRAAMIIHYPARGSHFKYVSSHGVSLPVATITVDNCSIIGKFPKDEWSEVPVLSVSHRHTCDLIQGSSGSPLIDYQTKQLIGVNWGGIKVSSGSEVRTDNAATTAAYAMQFLTSNGAPNRVSSNLNALVAQSKEEATAKKEDPFAAACGSIGGIASGSSLPFVMLLLTPLGITFYRRKYDV